MNKTEIENLILSVLNDYIKENDLEYNQEIGLDTRLIGSSGFMDSMDLVSFLVELEDCINDKYSLDLELANDSAMSSRTSPFINPMSLSNYILKLINK